MTRCRASVGAVVAAALVLLLSAGAPAAPPTLTLEATDAVIGEAVHATVDLGESPGASGEISFEVFASDDLTCTGPALDESSATVAGEGEYASEAFEATVAGDYHWTARYSGDEANEAAESICAATSTLGKASPGMTGNATSALAGNAITDQAALSGGFSPGGKLVFRAYGPGDPGCGGTPAYEATVSVDGNGPYSPAGFAPGPGLYRWTVDYEGDGNNEGAALGCTADGQTSAVGTIDVTLTAGAGGGTIGSPVTAGATLRQGASPGGQIVFKAFTPGDADCSGTAAFTSTVSVTGNGSYLSAPFTPARVGSFRWTVAYSGDASHAAAAVGCGKASSAITPAKPTIAGAAPRRIAVGTAFRDAATVLGGFGPDGTVTFRIYGPVAGGCAGAAYVNTVAVKGNGTVSSDPFVPLRTGRYSFAVSYSGDSENQAASEPCDSPGQVVQVVKRSPRVKPRAVLLGGNQISIRARLSGSVSPTGRITFRLYGPDDRRCKRKPKFSGGVTVKKNGAFSLARYLATRPGIYRLTVGYAGDQRNRRFSGTCANAQQIPVK
jgi:hypothetical protein